MDIAVHAETLMQVHAAQWAAASVWASLRCSQAAGTSSCQTLLCKLLQGLFLTCSMCQGLQLPQRSCSCSTDPVTSTIIA